MLFLYSLLKFCISTVGGDIPQLFQKPVKTSSHVKKKTIPQIVFQLKPPSRFETHLSSSTCFVNVSSTNRMKSIVYTSSFSAEDEYCAVNAALVSAMAWRTFFKKRIRLPASALHIDVFYLQGLAFSAIFFKLTPLPPHHTEKWGRLELWQITHHSTKKDFGF